LFYTIFFFFSLTGIHPPPCISVAELRSWLRVERKRDLLVLQLTERGFGAQKARAALGASFWDMEAALASLVGI